MPTYHQFQFEQQVSADQVRRTIAAVCALPKVCQSIIMLYELSRALGVGHVDLVMPDKKK
jgi:hypothetical protein